MGATERGTPEGEAVSGTRRAGDGTVAKALEVLDLVAAFERPVRFGELLARASYPKATLYRLVQTLARERMLSYDEERQTYAPGIRLVRLAHAAWKQSSLAPIARPVLDALSARLGETVHLAQLDHGQVLYVDKRSATNPVAMFSDLGKIGPAYCTGVGKAMLAHQPADRVEEIIAQQSFHPFTPRTLPDAAALRAELGRIRAEGVAFDREEHEAGIICVAVPILTPGGHCLGGLSVTSTTARNSTEGLADLVPDLREAAETIAREAEAWRFPETTRPGPAPLKETHR